MVSSGAPYLDSATSFGVTLGHDRHGRVRQDPGGHQRVPSQVAGAGEDDRGQGQGDGPGPHRPGLAHEGPQKGDLPLTGQGAHEPAITDPAVIDVDATGSVPCWPWSGPPRTSAGTRSASSPALNPAL